MQEALHLVNGDKITACRCKICSERWKPTESDVDTVVLSLQDPETGSFAGDEWGEIDTRFTYCAVACLSLLGQLDKLDSDKTVAWLEKCKNHDGGFGMVQGAESHAAQGE